MNGYGERCGNANLTSIIPALKLKMGLPVVTDDQLERLAETAHFVAEVVNVTPWAHQPYVGRSAFTHKGGLHVAAVEAAPETFEHIDPALVGNEQRVLISELSGKGAVLRKAHELGYELDGDDERVGRILRRLKQKEHEGFHYEAADASFDLLPARSARGPPAAVPPRELSRDRREARGRPRRHRGHGQGARGRRTHHRHRRGQRPGERPRHGAAPGDRAQVPAPRRHRPGELQGPHPRREQGHRRGHARAARRQRRRAGTWGSHRRLREHHRGELAGAGRLHRVRHAAAGGAPRARRGRERRRRR